MSTSPVHPAPRRSLWHRIVDWFRGAPTTAPPPPPPPPVPLVEVVYQPAGDGTVSTALCKGDVFEFQVHTHLVWSTREMTYDDLTTQAAEYSSSAQDTVRERIWKVARGFSPYHAAQAEEEMQKALESDWCYSGVRGKVRCAARVRVLPDPRVREHLLPYARQELDVEANATLGGLRAARFEAMILRWRKLIETLGHEAVVRYAAQLTDRPFADVVTRYGEDRRAAVQELVDVLGQASRDHEHVGLYEFADAYDQAVQAFRKQMGLDEGSHLPKVDS
ncbi:hypothetical protein ABT336_08975 [Micromonospora sp. NPDC000207]|uniref:hypothetical protein n=1 Tax=Micromonospora sp. NPDC000207 TaxID=3154246 RepID=UPI00332940D7